MNIVGDPVPRNPLEVLRGIQYVVYPQLPLQIASFEVIPECRTIQDLDAVDRNPVLVNQRVRIVTPDEFWLSKSQLLVFLAHGRREGSRHFSGKYDTELLIQAVNKWSDGNKLPPVQMFISCDEPNILGMLSRWDQSTKNNILGVAGVQNALKVDNDGFLDLRLDLLNGERDLSPFTYEKHFKRQIVESLFDRSSARKIRIISKSNL